MSRDPPRVCKITIFNYESDENKCKTTRRDSSKPFKFPDDASTACSTSRQHSVEDADSRRSSSISLPLLSLTTNATLGKPECIVKDQPPARKSIVTKTAASTTTSTISSTYIESAKKNECAKQKSRLSFGKNQKLNFIFGGNLQPKSPSQQDTAGTKPLSPTNCLSPSEMATPRLNALPNIRTVNIELEHPESPQASPPETTYEEIDMRTDQSSEKSDAPEEPEVELAEVKKKLNEIAQRVCSEPQENEKARPQIQSEVAPKGTTTGEPKAKCYEVVERAIKKLSECKGGIRLLHDFSENLTKIENSSELGERDRLIQLKLSIAHIQQVVQNYSIKSIEDDIEYFKGARNTYDKESVATSATYAETPQVEAQKKAGKYQLQVGKIHLENSLLRKLVNELEGVLKPGSSGKEGAKVTVPGVDVVIQTTPEEPADNERSKNLLKIISGLAKCRKAEESQKINQLKGQLNETTKELSKAKLVEKELREALAKKDEEIAKLNKKHELTIAPSTELTIETNHLNAKHANQMSALASLMICKTESISKDFTATDSKQIMASRNNAAIQKECLKRMLSLKAASRSMFNLLLDSAKVLLLLSLLITTIQYFPELISKQY